jgi:hypothetical protein
LATVMPLVRTLQVTNTARRPASETDQGQQQHHLAFQAFHRAIGEQGKKCLAGCSPWGMAVLRARQGVGAAPADQWHEGRAQSRGTQHERSGIRLKEEGRAAVPGLCKTSNTWRASTRLSSRRSLSPLLGSRSKCSARSPTTTCRAKQRAARFGAALECATAIARGTTWHDGRRVRRRGALPHITGNSREKGRNRTGGVLTTRRR